MTMLDIHSEALTSKQTVYHLFLGRYNKTEKRIYGFVEGKDDYCYYRGKIENMLPDGWEVNLWSAGSKDKVVNLHKGFDWNRFSKAQIVFFIDRDLSDFLGEVLPTDENIYITDKYYIENDMVNRATCDRVLTEVLSLPHLTGDDKEKILNLFEAQLHRFRTEMVSVMSWIIFWKRNGHKPCLNDINMNDMFRINAGQLQIIHHPKKLHNREEYIHKRCIIRYPSTVNIKAVLKEFRNADGPKRFIRGKYELWFFVKFALSIHRNISSFSTEYANPPRIHVSLSLSNAVTIIATRTRIVSSLKKFLKNTCVKYARDIENNAA